MILQALENYYQRKIKEKDSDIPMFGFSKEKISYELVLDLQGNLIQISFIGILENSKRYPKLLTVPQGVKKSVNIAANYLWGSTGYVLGIDTKGKQERSLKTFEAFKNLVKEIGKDIDDKENNAVMKFLDSWDPENQKNIERVKDAIDSNVVFRINGKTSFVHENPKIVEAWLKYNNSKGSKENGMCLVTGRESAIERLHPAIKGVKNAQSSGANIVNFNLDSFCSYFKEQGFNAPVSQEAAFAYTTALNSLLSDERRKIQIGDATTVFWAEKANPMEDWFAEIFYPRQEDTGTINEIRIFFKSVREGKMPQDFDPTTKFYVLGISPNASRLSIRFWYAGSVDDLSKKIDKHFKDIEIEKQYENDRDFPSLFQLLVQTAVLGKADNINPLLAGELARAIFSGGNYPLSMLSALINRIKSTNEDEKHKKITYPRLAMIKGILVRNFRKEVKMSLDRQNKEPAYLLGRLFAVLEKAQQNALGDINATIRDKYYASASTTPATTFPLLLKLNKYHTSKGEYGQFYDSLNAEILEQMPAKQFPAYLTLEEQGLFAIGYYHQRNDFFKKKEV